MLKLAEGNGMGSSCKYSYLSGACANRYVDSLQCIGEEKCQFSALNVMTARRAAEAGPHGIRGKWLGLYCEHHRRFHCDCSEGLQGIRGNPSPRPRGGPRIPGAREEP